MPTYDFKCAEHGYEERMCSMSTRKEQTCSTCGETMQQVHTRAPNLDQSAMAWSGMPGAVMKQQDRMHNQHRAVDQRHRKGSK